MKYQIEGGPSAGDICGLIHEQSTHPVEDVSRLGDELIERVSGIRKMFGS